MTETLAGLALIKEASKFSKTLQEYRSGYENPVGEVSGSDLKQISLDLSFTKSQEELVFYILAIVDIPSLYKIKWDYSIFYWIIVIKSFELNFWCKKP
jgi:hypothetical protein